jgi:predicted XRE-type DNA-binding protein
MPKVYFNETDKRIDKTYDFILLEMKKQKVRQKHIAAELGVTQPAVSKMLEDHTLSFEAFATIMTMLGKDITGCIR